ncbi:MAG: Na/Pi cotransporter family protein, partial [Rhodocyclaceae bacterium]|nr:Na/Pi cotransporter family protein [Rhodocyclaceae bacterium]
YSQKLSSVRLPVTLVDQLAECLRVLQYQENAVEACRQSAASSAALSPLPGPGLLEAARAFHGSVRQLAAAADHDHPEFDRAQVEWLLGKTETDYAHFKERLLAAGADGSLGVRRMQEHLQQASQLRRAAEQCAKAADHMSALDHGIEPPAEKHGERLAA